MMTKTAYYMQMAQEAAAQITGSKEQWTAFLTTSARLYKYPFAEQLMIYKQRPEATACAEYDLWNDRMNRYVKRGSKGIALLDMRGEQPRLRYVRDVHHDWVVSTCIFVCVTIYSILRNCKCEVKGVRFTFLHSFCDKLAVFMCFVFLNFSAQFLSRNMKSPWVSTCVST